MVESNDLTVRHTFIPVWAGAKVGASGAKMRLGKQANEECSFLWEYSIDKGITSAEVGAQKGNSVWPRFNRTLEIPGIQRGMYSISLSPFISYGLAVFNVSHWYQYQYSEPN